MKYLIFAIVLLISGCAPTQKYGTMLDSWMGASAEKLILSWGIPQNTFIMSNGNKVIEYSRNRISRINNISIYCRTTFIINKGMIINWSWTGNDCKSK